MNLRYLHLLCLLLSSVIGCSEARRPAASEPVDSATVTNPPAATATAPPSAPAAASRPFLISEAAMPAGFPPPGPVGQVIVKHYPACREARVDADAVTQSAGTDGMFMSLFHHIQSNNIPMTAPVEITWSPPGTTQPATPVAMAFIYKTPDTGTPTTASAETTGGVRVIDIPAQTVLSIGIRGGYEKDNFEAALGQLDQYLKSRASAYTRAGPPRYLGYNSPFVPPFMRFGEVQIPVTVR